MNRFLTYITKRPLLLAALVIVLVGGAVFLVLPLIVGTTVLYPVSSADHISTWTWKGVYADGAGKQADTIAEIARLKGTRSSQGANEYNTDIGIASEYELLGDGKSAYQYLSKAITESPKQGLAYMNMGHLMEEMGAFHTAHTAYDAAVAAEPTNPVFQAARENFLIQHPGI